MPTDIAIGAFLALSGRVGGYRPADVHVAGVIMMAGSELVMTSPAVQQCVPALPPAARTIAAPRGRAGVGE